MIDIIHKMASIIGLRELSYKLLKNFVNSDSQISFDDAGQAIEYLHEIYPDPSNSCICTHEFNDTDCDLEIIVPCYNVEKYVNDCITSIISQKTRYSFFITIINDGSTDTTGKILSQYEHVPNIKIITQANRGFSGARNRGIEQLHGRYVMFCDSDDILTPDTIEHLMTIADRTGADIVDSSHIRFSKSKLYNIIQKPQLLRDTDNTSTITGYPWGKVIKRDIFTNIKFPECYWFEDTIVNMIISSLASLKASTSFVSYRYRMNNQSISHTAKGGKLLDTLYITSQLLYDRAILKLKFDAELYKSFIYQILINERRTRNLGGGASKAIYEIQRNLLLKYFPDDRYSSSKFNVLVKAIRENDYRTYKTWCRFH